MSRRWVFGFRIWRDSGFTGSGVEGHASGFRDGQGFCVKVSGELYRGLRLGSVQG